MPRATLLSAETKPGASADMTTARACPDVKSGLVPCLADPAVPQEAVHRIEVSSGACFNHVSAGAFPGYQLAVAKIGFNGHFTEGIFACRNSSKRIIHELATRFGDPIDCFQRGIHRPVADARISDRLKLFCRGLFETHRC